MIIVADNLQIMNPTVGKAIRDLNPEPIRNITKMCKNAGADIIDINPGPLSLNGDKKMTFLVESVQEATNLRLSLDTNNPEALKAGLRACRIKPIINGFSLEPRKLTEILPLAIDFDADIIGFLLLPNGHVPLSSEERLDTALKLVEEAEKAGLNLERLIIDPVIVPLTWRDSCRQANEVLSTLKLLPELLGFAVKTIAGISNFTSGIPCRTKRLLLEEVYLSLLAQSGLNMGLMNVLHTQSLKAAGICDSILGCKVFSWMEI